VPAHFSVSSVPLCRVQQWWMLYPVAPRFPMRPLQARYPLAPLHPSLPWLMEYRVLPCLHQLRLLEHWRLAPLHRA
jgi:hypothetical protein